MTDIDRWLERLDMAQYTGAFHENGVDLQLLPDLTNDDLKDLGVTRLADRKVMLKAIGALAPADATAQSGELVRVLAAEGEVLGFGHYAPASRLRYSPSP